MLKAKTMFDTLAYANKLKRAGLDPMLAEIQAEAQLELLRELTDNHFATKQDINDLKQDINDLKRDIDELRSATKQDIKNLENNIIALQDKLVVKMGGFMALGIGTLATLITVLHVY